MAAPFGPNCSPSRSKTTPAKASVRLYAADRDPGAAFLFGLLVFMLVHGCGESLLKLPTFVAFIPLTGVMRLAQTPPVAAVPTMRTEVLSSTRIRLSFLRALPIEMRAPREPE